MCYFINIVDKLISPMGHGLYSFFEHRYLINECQYTKKMFVYDVNALKNV